MSAAVTIAELEADIRWQADQERAQLRHTSAKLRRAIGQSIDSYREMVSDQGWPYFLRVKTGTLPVGATTDPDDETILLNWGKLDTSEFNPPVVRIYGLDLHYSDSQEELSSVSFSERNAYQRSPGVPQAYFVYDQTNVGILPPASSAYRYTLSYLPLASKMLNDDDEFNPGVPGGEQWVIWDVMQKLLYRDNYPDLAAAAANERERHRDQIVKQVGKLIRAFPKHKLNTRARRKAREARRFL